MDTLTTDASAAAQINTTDEQGVNLLIRNSYEQLFSKLRISGILLCAGLALSTISIWYEDMLGSSEYTLYYGLSLAGVYYLFRTFQYYLAIRNIDTSEPIPPAISAWRKFFESAILVLSAIAAAWFLNFYFAPLEVEEPLLSGNSAQSESSAIEGWKKFGMESKVARFSLPYEASFEWSIFRQDLETGPTKAIIYTALSDDGENLYKVTVEWVTNEKGERILTPDFAKEAEYIKEFYGFKNNAIVTDMEFRDISMKKYTFKSDNQKLVGVWFEKNNIFYDVTVWPYLPGKADEELKKVLETFEFVE